MRFTWLFVIAVLLFGGCISAPEPDGVDYAYQIVWQQQYQMDGHPAPYVEWVMPAQLNCADGRGWISAENNGECVGGLYHQENNSAQVAWPGDNWKISAMAFAHELCHAFSYQTTGDADGQHMGPCFVPPADCYVSRANDALAREDL